MHSQVNNHYADDVEVSVSPVCWYERGQIQIHFSYLSHQYFIQNKAEDGLPIHIIRGRNIQFLQTGLKPAFSAILSYCVKIGFGAPS